MNEKKVRDFLAVVRRHIHQLGLYPSEHPLHLEGAEAMERAVDEIMTADGEVVFTILDDTIYFGPQLLAYTSLEFNGLLRMMQKRGLDSFTLIDPVSRDDLIDFADFVAGMSDDIPASGTIRLNERPLARSDLEVSEMGELRQSYAASLDVLRNIGFAMKGGAEFELGGVALAVQTMVEKSVEQPAASLLLATVKGHDEYTYYHSVNASIYAISLGRLLGLSEEQLVAVGTGGLLHDIGKVGVPAGVLQYPGRLDREKWDVIQLHPQNGASAILAAAGAAQEVAAAIALEHHARFDGSGYPKLGNPHTHAHDDNGHPHGHPLHLFSRVVSVVDTYDAITTRRSYRRAETPNRALNVLLRGANTSYDPDMVMAFIRMMGAYPAGSLLQLSTGQLVMVTHLAENDPKRPSGVIVRGADGMDLADPEPIDFNPDLVVDQVLPAMAGIDPAGLLEKPAVREAIAG
ncbi:MAG: HD domain-containing protein [Acidimicrobiia bacterium]|nr:HD domain-containing protein [Acidimicrobiia bacterium]